MLNLSLPYGPGRERCGKSLRIGIVLKRTQILLLLLFVFLAKAIGLNFFKAQVPNLEDLPEIITYCVLL